MEDSKHQAKGSTEIHRRPFLAGTGSAASSTIMETATAQEPGRSGLPGRDRPFPGMISRQRNPDNLEFPFPSLETFLTPNEHFYVRNHFQVAELDPKTWRLAISGAVAKPFEISLDDLRKMKSQTVTALLECSGNSRVLLRPPQLGVRWEQGGVSNAEWTGVPLSAVLDRAGVGPGAIEVILEGADRGAFQEPLPRTPGTIHYSHSLPLSKARRPEVLLAYQMNGRDLPPAHGFPVRVVVPGWYGMASVKWLQRIVVTDRPFYGYFHTFMYSIWERRAGIPDLVPVTEMHVKAQIARPALHEVIAAGSRYRIFGAAWAGEPEVTRVEVSADGGKSWSEARLLDKPVPFAWRFWEFEWAVPRAAGRHTLIARAADSRKRVQPLEQDEDRRDAIINQVQPIVVEVR